MWEIFDDKKNRVIFFLTTISLFLIIFSAFMWVRIISLQKEKCYLWSLTGKQYQLEKLLVAENRILRDKAHVSQDAAVLAQAMKKKTPASNRGFLFWKGKPKK